MSIAVDDRSRSTPSDAPTPPDRPTDSPAGPWRAGRDARRAALAAALSLAGGWGFVAGWWTPRGPVTTAEAMTSIVVSLGVGGLAGFLLKSRWAMLVTPVVFVAVVELVRMRVDGPMVDGIHPSFYGAIALLTGRGFHALLTLLPMVLGASLGAALARTRAPDPQPARRRSVRAFRRAGTGLLALCPLALTAALARPATTAPITGPDGHPLPGSVAELTTVEVDGHDLGLLIRGSDVDNPVLLFLAGGPGGSELGAMRRHLPELEEHFTVATWDQRGSGTSYPELDPTDTVTLDGYVSDTIAVTEHLRRRFGADNIYLAGQSWGTTLGVLAVQQRPDLYAAFVGSGQMVSQRATDLIFYEDTLAWASRTGDDGLRAELEAVGPPPYDEMFPYETALSHEQAVYPYDRTGNSEGSGQMSENLLVEEYTLIDQVHILGAFMDTFAALYPQLQEIDFRESATEFAVPMYFVQGAHEARGRSEVFDEWYSMIEAPTKDLVVLETSGHRPLWEQPDRFVDYLVGTVLEQTRP